MTSFLKSLRIYSALGLLLSLITSGASAEQKHGRLVLSFDDGHPSWISIIAPELSRVGGTATAYVNNTQIHAGLISFEELRQLQNHYHWEIGTHTYNHYDATVYLELHGLPHWTEMELDKAIAELQAQELTIKSLVFPFNKYAEELKKIVLARVSNFRRKGDTPLPRPKEDDHSFPGRSIDLGHYMPFTQLSKLIDTAHQKNQSLYLYGHQVLPDNEFIVDEVVSADKRTLVARDQIEIPENSSLCLVPNSEQALKFSVLVKHIEGNTITVANRNLKHLTKPGAQFIIGPCLSLRLSDFQHMLDYAAGKLHFSTVSEALGD